MPIDPSRPPAASTLGLVVVAALGGAVLLAAAVHLAELEVTAGALQLTVALQTIGIVSLLAAAASALSLYRVDGRAPGLFLTIALVVYALGVLPLGGIVSTLVPGPAAVVHDEVVCFLVTAVVVGLGLTALRHHDRPTPSARTLSLCGVAVTVASVAVVVLVDRVINVLWADLDRSATQVGLDLASGGLWLGLAVVAWRQRALSTWLERGALVAAGFVAVRVLDAASVDVEGSAAHLAATLVAACLAAVVGLCAVSALVQAIDAARRGAEATARGLDEATGKILDRDARSEELHHDAVNAISGLQAALTLASSEDDHLDATTRRRLLTAALAEVAHLEHLVLRGTHERSVVFDVVAVIDSVVQTRRAQGLSVEVAAGALEAPVDGGGLQAMGRPGDLAAVLHNLLLNAQNHAPGSAVEIDVSRGPDHVGISVRDEGPGIAHPHRERVFERGVRGPSSTGSGLGLYVAHELMRDQDGGLDLLPADAGCHFVVTLPAASTATAGDGSADGARLDWTAGLDHQAERLSA